MGRETIAEIIFGGEGPIKSVQLLRVLRDRDNPHNFHIVEAYPKKLRESIDREEPFDWRATSIEDTRDLTPEQLGSIIVAKIQQIARQ